MFSTIPLVLVGAAVYGRAMKRLQRRFQDQLAAATSIADETLSNMRTIRACSREQWAVSQYAMNIAQAYETGRRLSWAFGVFAGVVLFLSQGAMLLVIWFGGVLVIRGELTTGALSSFVIYTLQVSVSLGFLLGLYGDLMQAVGASARIFALLHRRPAIVTRADAVRPDTLEGRVELRNVRFQYPSRPEVDVLHGMSFSLIPGKVVALVSPSGGGKSTIVSLLERFYDLPEDECDTRSGRLNSLDKLTSDGDAPGIFIDGIDIRDLDLAWLRRNVALVAQEPALFALSIRDNITFGMDPAEAAQVTDTELVAVAREANAHDFVMTFPDGYDTMCGERGVGLSGGQRQRIAIARGMHRVDMHCP